MTAIIHYDYDDGWTVEYNIKEQISGTEDYIAGRLEYLLTTGCYIIEVEILDD